MSLQGSPHGTHTPLIRQYLDIKARHPESILFFRVGDFYEMFFEDAEEGSRLLGITLTSRNSGASADVPLAGVPAKAIDEYLPRLVSLGKSVAVCDQVEDAAVADGLVRREVVAVITPGTAIEDSLLDARRNNFVACVAGDGPLGIAVADLSTGEFDLRECGLEELADALARVEPAEVLVASDRTDVPGGAWTLTRRDAWRFDPEFGEEALRRRFSVASTEGFGLSPGADGHLVAAAGALVAYLEEVRPAGLGHLAVPRVERPGGTMHLDEMTRRNLELVEPLRAEGGATLLDVLDRTRTAMGARLLRRWLLNPLLDRARISDRQDAVSDLVRDRTCRDSLRERLGRIRDLERSATRIAAARAVPRELLGLGRSLGELPHLGELAAGRGGRIGELGGALDTLEEIRELVDRAIATDAPASLGDGGVIRAGFSSELDELRELRAGAVDWIASMQERERRRTGIQSLKVGHNKVFGYYLEVTRPNLERVPEDYQRRQTLTGSERFVTPELKEWEERVLDAQTRIEELEARLYREVRQEVSEQVPRIQEAARRVAELDVLAALAHVAERNGYHRPEVVDGFGLEIRSGRHPVVETMMPREDFIPNDVVLDREGFVMVLTGPNMAGKSTVLRQVGLIALLAQVGSFVPAERARIGLCDRIFTRVGASDSLARGQSTFMVEMTETATILNAATDRSLILLDEIGRGTSTYDGVSIAWAVTAYIHDRIGARTVFATHYHELVELADLAPGVMAANVAVRERGHEIVFLRRLERGGSDRSYGVHVARLAGLPREVIERATVVLHQLEGGPSGAGSRLAGLLDRDQYSLFAGPDAAEAQLPADPALRERLSAIEPERLTPIEALVALAELKRLAGGEADGSGGVAE
ncbi:MAG: DNA mismatch repair protein MutS [Gemmatimonadota bacterium]|nr:MAG: DNA mismatch repair protein MutS [Gemmatimonadota bacterium]